MNVSRNEAAAINSQLALRFNTQHGCWEVYTTIHGSGIFRWYKISDYTRDWYLKNFPRLADNVIFPYAINAEGNLIYYSELTDKDTGRYDIT